MAPENDPAWMHWTQTSALVRATAVAEHAHRKLHPGGPQLRKHTGEPYIVHPMAVAAMVANDPHVSWQAAVAAVLHDVVEDTSVTIEEISEWFGPVVAQFVWGMTDQCHDGNRAERKKAERERLAAEPADVQTIKLYDIGHNASTIFPYDPNFAVVFAVEMELLIEALTLASPVARTYANLQLTAGRAML